MSGASARFKMDAMAKCPPKNEKRTVILAGLSVLGALYWGFSELAPPPGPLPALPESANQQRDSRSTAAPAETPSPNIAALAVAPMAQSSAPTWRVPPATRGVTQNSTPESDPEVDSLTERAEVALVQQQAAGKSADPVEIPPDLSEKIATLPLPVQYLIRLAAAMPDRQNR